MNALVRCRERMEMPGNAKLLLVSRDHDRLIALRKLLQPLADEALLAHSGSAALDLCRGHEVSAVLMDLDPSDPGSSGTDLSASEGIHMAQQIHSQAQSRQTPIIVLTSEAQGRTPAVPAGAGPVDFLPKAAPPDALKHKVEEYA
ncbi:MAG TPA: response regulator, partial [Bryobacteraceae bacterium]|nr:response regulator [Bryobacteraceae bacterium]